MLGNDIRYAFRQLRRAPGFAATAVLTLALGIGSSSAIFCIMDALWLHPMPVPHQRELVRVFSTTAQDSDGMFTFPDYLTFAQRATALRGLAAIGRRGSLMPRADGTSAMLLTNIVSNNFFDLLGMHPFLGRIFTAQDSSTLRTHPGLLLSYRCWQREFNGDPHIVGRQISLRRGEHTINQVEIWGVLPADFREIDANSDRDLWMPAGNMGRCRSPVVNSHRKELSLVQSHWPPCSRRYRRSRSAIRRLRLPDHSRPPIQPTILVAVHALSPTFAIGCRTREPAASYSSPSLPACSCSPPLT